MPQSLYTCTAKNNPSTANIERDDSDWYERFVPYKEFLLNSINRQYWEPYLDFAILDQWRTSGKPEEEEKQHYINIAVKLAECLQYQNMVEIVKENTCFPYKNEYADS